MTFSWNYIESVDGGGEGQAEDEQHEISDGEVDEENIGHGSHRWIAKNDENYGTISNNT